MIPREILERHLLICNELYQLTIEENRFLKQHQRPPEASLLDKRRQLLARLDESLQVLKQPEPAGLPSAPDERDRRSASIEQARARVLQILQLQKENEQLLLRYSLGSPHSVPLASEPPPADRLQKMYTQHLR